MSKICVIGVGRVGLVTAVCLTELGHHVIGIDKDSRRIECLAQGQSPFYEPGLDALLQKGLGKGRLSFSTRIGEGVTNSDIIFICVGTPAVADGRADLSQVEQVARAVAHHMDKYKLMVEKSTVPVKTSQWIRRTIGLFNRTGIEFDVVSNPEFLREGSAIQDFMHPDRIVIGVESERAKELMLNLYDGFDCPILVTDSHTAEIIKHASNSFLAMKISYINMIADLCEQAGADVHMVAEGMGYDARIGRAFLNAGVGYGGSCFPKDVKAFTALAEELGVDFGLLKRVDLINEDRTDRLLAKLKEALWVLSGKTIGILGLAFKPETDDIREAPSTKIIGRVLQEAESHVKLYDARARQEMQEIFPPSDRVEYVTSPYEAAQDVEALVILTEWDEFKGLDLVRIKRVMRTPIIVDGRNLFEPEQMQELGFEYYCMGRKNIRNRY